MKQVLLFLRPFVSTRNYAGSYSPSPALRGVDNSAKRLLGLLLLCGLRPFMGFGQATPAPEKLYETAFHYIRHDRQLRRMGLNLRDVAVFDSIVHQDLSYFSEDVGSLWGYSARHQLQLLDSLFRLKETTYHKPYSSPLTARLTTNSGTRKGCTVILFSRLHNNLLLAQVSDNQEGGPGLKNIFSTFDQSVIYLFMFDPEGKIQRCYSHLIHYN